MPLTTHGACGKSWKQRGNCTGHCGRCHETLEGLATIDAHQRVRPDGSVICLSPAAVVFHGEPLRPGRRYLAGPSTGKERVRDIMSTIPPDVLAALRKYRIKNPDPDVLLHVDLVEVLTRMRNQSRDRVNVAVMRAYQADLVRQGDISVCV